MNAARFENWRWGPSAVELQWDDTGLWRRHGRLTALGPWTEATWRSGLGPEAEAQRQIKRLRQKGFWPGHHNRALISAIEADPDDEAGYFVYGDWLAQFGDPRSALIQMQANGAHDAAERLMTQHAETLRPPHWKAVPPVRALEWRLGFVHTVIMHTRWNVEEAWASVRKHPSGRFVQRLVLQGFRPEFSGPGRSMFGTRLIGAEGSFELRSVGADAWIFGRQAEGSLDVQRWDCVDPSAPRPLPGR